MSDGVIVQLANGDVEVNFGADGTVSGAGALTIANRLTKVTATGTIGMATVAESAGALSGVTTLTASGAGSFSGLSSSSGLTVSSGTSALQAVTCTTLTGSGILDVTHSTTGDNAAYLRNTHAAGYGPVIRGGGGSAPLYTAIFQQYDGTEVGRINGSGVLAMVNGVTCTTLTASSTTASTSTTTGCATFAGGIGVAGALHLGSTAIPTTSATGALVVAGGIGVAHTTTGVGIFMGSGTAGSSSIESSYGNMIRHRQYGYAGYWAVQLGDSARGIGFGIDPTSITGGTFTGNNTDFFFGRGVAFGTPNAGNTDWLWGIQINGGASTKNGSRVRIDDTGLGFFGATPVARASLAAASGTATRTTFDTTTVTTQQLAERVMAIIDDLRAYGLEG